MPKSTEERLAGVDVMILDALRHRPHRTHMTVEKSVDTLQRIGARQSYIIHMCHDLDHETTAAMLPPGIDVAFDGLTLELPHGGE
jgi:phosphoribosyl 1,2-cyclic phosphate phosphodiesterase